MPALDSSAVQCRACGETKSADEFYQRLTRYGLLFREKDCKSCVKARVYAAKQAAMADPQEAARRRAWRRDHKRKLRSGLYVQGDKRRASKTRKTSKRATIDFIKGQLDSHVKRWRNVQSSRIYMRKLRSTPKGAIDGRMGSAIWAALKRNKAGRQWEGLVGYTLSTLMAHLERQFEAGMGWHNIGEWHIDHRLPRSMFNYETERDPDFKACWALTNLQPMWARDNLVKNDRRVVLL